MFSNRKSASPPAKSSLSWERACSSAWGNEPALDTFCPSGGGGGGPGPTSPRVRSFPQPLPRHSLRASPLFLGARVFLSAPRHWRNNKSGEQTPEIHSPPQLVL